MRLTAIYGQRVTAIEMPDEWNVDQKRRAFDLAREALLRDEGLVTERYTAEGKIANG